MPINYRYIENNCDKSPTGRHFPNRELLTVAIEVLDNDPKRVVLDVPCKHCGTSGSFALDLEEDVDINW